jgi:hypothetical protein
LGDTHHDRSEIDHLAVQYSNTHSTTTTTNDTRRKEEEEEEEEERRRHPEQYDNAGFMQHYSIIQTKTRRGVQYRGR